MGEDTRCPPQGNLSARRRGLLYVADVVPCRALRSLVIRDEVAPFPELDAGQIAHVRRSAAYMHCSDLPGVAALDFARGFAPDYLVLAGAPVIHPPLLGLARHGAINRHLGLAPHFRGSDCPLWALALGQPTAVGYTIHFVTERVDGGDIIAQKSVHLDRTESFGAYLARVQRKASEAFVDVLSAITDCRPLPHTPQPAQGRHFPPAGLTTLLRAARTYRRAVRDSALATEHGSGELRAQRRAERG